MHQSTFFSSDLIPIPEGAADTKTDTAALDYHFLALSHI